ncbi:YdeI/OmpD-associated family protein [Sphingobium sp. AS12]|uniref:YdeI/OmpD-associated family protein n=1 Tax=Sphingobium sp. AS12 TaxID=2849495 RepID=UPI001C317417|nr:YdeI/OmpD-associated family protein [Sphingobium sp. AS12]MBV2146684.1 YdeI/OmpD-associated family protein [Sphingobium sp. AS12]
MVGDARIDAYIARQADFARPILTHIRALVHATVREAGEAIKWGMPFFTYKDQNLCSMAAFKGHAAFGFWHDKVGRDDARQGAMGQFGRITRLSDLPPDAEIAALLAQAMALIDAGDRPRAGPKEPRAPLPVHPAFAEAIAADPAAAAVWAAFPPGKVRDYCEWINDAKGDSTRNKRMAQAVEWIAQGKGRNWKYQR